MIKQDQVNCRKEMEWGKGQDHREKPTQIQKVKYIYVHIDFESCLPFSERQ